MLENCPDLCLKLLELEAKPKLSLSQTELAGMINATRENVNRCLRNWHRQRIVDVSERWITLLQRDMLEEMVENR